MRTNKEQQEFRNKTIEKWQSSGLSQKEFCRAENIRYSLFHYWYKRYKSGSTVSDNFVTLTCKESLPAVENIQVEVIHPSGIRIVFHQTPSVACLKSLLQ